MKATRARSSRILAAASLAVALLSGACETTPDVAHPQSYRKDGISFDHPSNWSVTEDVAQPAALGIRYLFVESPGSAIVIVQYYGRGMDTSLEEFSADFHRRWLEKAENLVQLGPDDPIVASSGSTRSVRSVVAGIPRDGIEQTFSIAAAGTEVPHRYHAFKLEAAPATAFVIVQAADEDWDLVAPGFDLVLASLRIE
jgi:hypothetical protein